MRILMIAPEPFLEPRGTPFSVYHRAKALVSLGYEVDLLTYPIGRQVTLAGLCIYRVPAIPFIREVKIGPSFAKLPLDALLFLSALWHLSLRRYRYLHTHEEAGLMGIVLSMLFGCKHLYDMHSDLAQQMSNFSFTRNKSLIRLVTVIQRLIVRRSDAVIAICPDLERTVKEIDPRKAVYMIENVAVDENLPPADEDAVLRLRKEWNLGTGPTLVYTGTFEKYQGIDLLLRSVSEVCAEFPSARYVLVGGKHEQIERQRLLAQELGIADMVCFVGQRPIEEMPQYMALANILLSPRSEGTNTPLKLYTYLRSGKPVLATAIHSHTQILMPGMAKLVAPSPQALAQGALELLRNPQQAAELGMRGKLVAEEHYSWAAFLEKNRRAYNEFTGKK
ncbi:MAG TPA: glycosyltransferase family 4 protein [Ktedonobacteraceae bacterium]|nr:glycosyltransferase family 4 protein [Ktedonobacteraceae bacterium]